MKKALIFDPYTDTVGGGERYVLTFATTIAKLGYAVEIVADSRLDLRAAEKRFGFDLSNIKIGPHIRDIYTRGSIFKKLFLTPPYDLVFFVSDGSLPFLFGKRNLVHFQVPFTKLGGNFFTNFIKGLFIHKLVFNSNFTAGVVKKQLPFCSSVVLYPPIDVDGFTPGKKENIILSVARFDSPSHAKRQDILIRCFKKVYEKNKDYKLILAGGLKGGEEYLENMRSMAGKLPIQFVPNPNFDEIKKLYAKAKIFWHAASYDIDETKEPEKVEHFGITTAEAMSAGAVPVVINRGGQREIIDGNTGYLCDSIEEMVNATLSLINIPEKLKLMSEKDIIRAKDFSVERFSREVKNIVEL